MIPDHRFNQATSSACYFADRFQSSWSYSRTRAVIFPSNWIALSSIATSRPQHCWYCGVRELCAASDLASSVCFWCKSELCKGLLRCLHQFRLVTACFWIINLSSMATTGLVALVSLQSACLWTDSDSYCFGHLLICLHLLAGLHEIVLNA